MRESIEALNWNCLTLTLKLWYLHNVLGIATIPYDKNITNKNIPNALEAASNIGGKFVILTFPEMIRYPRPINPTRAKIP